MLYASKYEDVRMFCHHIKNGRAKWETKMYVAQKLRPLIEESNAIIVPVPSHIGYATYTKQIAEMTGLEVLDCIRCFPHEALYDRKKRGEIVRPEELQFYLDATVTVPERPIYIFDLVSATGVTAKAAQRLFKDRRTEMLVFAYDDKVKRVV